MPSSLYKAIIFDMGGVLVPGPMELITKQGVQDGERVLKAIFSTNSGFSSTFEKFECGELSMEEMLPLFNEYLEKNHPDIPPQSLDVLKIKSLWETSGSHMLPIWEQVLEKLRNEGYTLAVLTNNFWPNKDKTGKTIAFDPKYFDAVFESCRLGMRKPDERIYRHVLNELKIKPEEAIFLDDMKINIEGAEKVGINGIQCLKVEDAIKTLEQKLNLKLLNQENGA